MPTMKLAFDRSARRIDADGRLHVDRSHISKATVNPYYGKEIPGYEALGLQPDTVYRLFRDPVELERGAATFARLPILSEHVPVTVDTPRPDLVVGTASQVLTIQRVNGTVDVNLSFNPDFVMSGDIIRADVSGTSIRFFKNGRLIHTANQTGFVTPTGVCGIQASTAVVTKFKSFGVRSLS